MTSGEEDLSGLPRQGRHVNALPALRGQYFFSDYCSGWLRSLVFLRGRASAPLTWNVPNVGPVLSLGEDGRQELYLLAARGGQVYRLEAQRK